MTISLPFTYVLICLGALSLVLSRIAKRRRRLPLPPGPPADFLIGHLRSLPTTASEETLIRWHRQYGKPVDYSFLWKLLNPTARRYLILQHLRHVYCVVEHPKSWSRSP